MGRDHVTCCDGARAPMATFLLAGRNFSWDIGVLVNTNSSLKFVRGDLEEPWLVGSDARALSRGMPSQSSVSA